ncbi:hypothetical protein AX14_001123 [Amanita brunnescens Koide BX004]|nr:hypothetical protein AX14_001123 [Amanita brunnescens Koide BX004]
MIMILFTRQNYRKIPMVKAVDDRQDAIMATSRWEVWKQTWTGGSSPFSICIRPNGGWDQIDRDVDVLTVLSWSTSSQLGRGTTLFL